MHHDPDNVCATRPRAISQRASSLGCFHANDDRAPIPFLFLTSHPTLNLFYQTNIKHQAPAFVSDDDGAAWRRKEKKMRQQHHAAEAATSRIPPPVPGASPNPRRIVLGVHRDRWADNVDNDGTGHVCRALARGPTAVQQQQHCGLPESLAPAAYVKAAVSTTLHQAHHHHHERTHLRGREWAAQEFARSVQRDVDCRGREAAKSGASPHYPRGPSSNACP